MSKRAIKTAESVVNSFAISCAQEIDVDAVCADFGLSVSYERLNGCNATLVGVGDVARTTIHASGNRCRERFSAAHELGHWLLHRGKSYQCAMHDADVNLARGSYQEVEADIFAMHFLMPKALFGAHLREKERPDFSQIKEISTHFGVTLAAALLRFVEVSSQPVIAASFQRNRLRWSVSSSCVPATLRLKSLLSEQTSTHELIYEGRECESLKRSAVSDWFDDEQCARYSLLEQCAPGAAGQAFVLLYLQPEMLETNTPRMRPRLACSR